MAYCRKCGKELEKDARFCSSCGTEISGQENQTPRMEVARSPRPIIISTEIKPSLRHDASYLDKYDTPTPVETKNRGLSYTDLYMMSKRRNKWTAVLFCLFLGVFGAHKFYEGKTALGVLYIFTFGLFFIGVIIDLITLLSKPNPYYV